MELKPLKKFLTAMKAAGITKWDALIDTPTHYYHDGERKFNYLDEDGECVINIASGRTTSTPIWEKPILVRSAHLADIHEVIIAGDVNDVKKFCGSYGIDVTPELENILVNIQSSNTELIPETGNYVFRKLSEDEIAKLSEEEKADYEQKLKEHNRKVFPGPVRVD